MSRCTGCSFCWADNPDQFEYCHFVSYGEWDPAPCEIDDERGEHDEDGW